MDGWMEGRKMGAEIMVSVRMNHQYAMNKRREFSRGVLDAARKGKRKGWIFPWKIGAEKRRKSPRALMNVLM